MKIISFCLWGNNPKYTIGAIKNADLANEIYPDWKCRFYVTSDVNKNIIERLQQNSQVVITSSQGNWKFTTERFKAIDDKECEAVIFRDCDSRLNKREASAVNQWLKSDKTLHIMKDHPYHNSFPILAGMWGLKKDKFCFNMNSLLKLYANNEQYHYDQIFLNDYIWKYFSDDCLIHDEFFAKTSFPTKRESLEFVGQVFDENNDTIKEHLEILKNYLKNEKNKC
jgi:hypothetical protein